MRLLREIDQREGLSRCCSGGGDERLRFTDELDRGARVRHVSEGVNDGDTRVRRNCGRCHARGDRGHARRDVDGAAHKHAVASVHPGLHMNVDEGRHVKRYA